MKTTTFLTLFCLVLAVVNSSAQMTIRQTEKPIFTPAQSTALDALYEQGGVIIQLAEDQPGKPVILIDYGGHPDFQDSWIDYALVFTELRVLRFNDTAITHAGVARLAALKKLEKLELQRTRVTPEAVTVLKKTLPNIEVSLSPAKLDPAIALAEIKKAGGLLVHYDERGPVRPGPVIMIDATNHQEFKDEWTKYFAALPKLAQVDLGGTALSDAGMVALAEVPELKALHLEGTQITDQGLAKLANCKQLEYIGLEKTAVTPAGIAALRQALPQVEINVEPEKLNAVTPFPGGRPVVPFVERTPPPRAEISWAESTGPAVKRFTAAEIAAMRDKMTTLGGLPADTPNGWSKSKIDPAKILTVTPAIKLRTGYMLRAYVFKEEGNSNGFVWAMPADAEFPEPKDCPILESHFLKAPNSPGNIRQFSDW